MHAREYHSSEVRFFRGTEKRAVQEGSEACALLRKYVTVIESGFKFEYFKFKSRVIEFVGRVVDALLVSALSIASAHLVGVGLVLTQPDGYERAVTPC